MDKTQAINEYKEIQDDCNQYGYPTTSMGKLPEVKSCIPQFHNELKETMSNISRALYRQLTMVIPSNNKVMMDIW